MRIDGGVLARLAALALLGAGLYVAGWLLPSDQEYTESARVREPTTINGDVHIVPSDAQPAVSRAFAEAVASASYPGGDVLPVMNSWLGYFDGPPDDAKGLVWVVALDPGPHRYRCESGPAPVGNVPGTEPSCPNYRTTEVTVVVNAMTGDWVMSTEEAEPFHPADGFSSSGVHALL